MPFKNENALKGLPVNGSYQVGRSNVDSGNSVERNILLPWPQDPAATWVYFDCVVEHRLDSGIVVHNRLPQVDNDPDSLGAAYLDDAKLDTYQGTGINLKCQDQYQDIKQRMGHARYWFRLHGQALRVGYRIPIPKLRTVGGVAVIPHDRTPQYAFCRVRGNFGGIILWHAAWSLWYTTLVPPNSNSTPEVDPALHITGNAKPPDGLQAPYTTSDGNAVKQAPTQRPLGPNIIR